MLLLQEEEGEARGERQGAELEQEAEEGLEQKQQQRGGTALVPALCENRRLWCLRPTESLHRLTLLLQQLLQVQRKAAPHRSATVSWWGTVLWPPANGKEKQAPVNFFCNLQIINQLQTFKLN